MSVFEKIAAALFQVGENSAKLRTMQVMQGLNDNFLQTIGVSREQLDKGPSAWPWREDQVYRGAELIPVKVSQVAANNANYKSRKAG